MKSGCLVVVNCANPREKFWGVLEKLDTVGLTLRGIPMDAFEDWLQQHASGGQRLLGPVTLFLPLHRIERIELDETVGAVEGIGDRFQRVAGVDPVRALLGESYSRADEERQM